MGRVGNQRNYRILTLKKTSPERRKKKNIGYRVASNERGLIRLEKKEKDNGKACKSHGKIEGLA